jgi:hypothetical protein
VFTVVELPEVDIELVELDLEVPEVLRVNVCVTVIVCDAVRVLVDVSENVVEVLEIEGVIVADDIVELSVEKMDSTDRVALSKSYKVSACNVILVCVTFGAAGAGLAAAFGSKKPSQPFAAVAGVQAASRQHNVPSPFLHGVPVALTQLSTV